MPSRCVFDFDRPKSIFYSGEVVKGRIRLETTNEKVCSGVFICFYGAAQANFNRAAGSSKDAYSGYENYINSRTQVFPEGNLPPGTHVHEFAVPIPAHAPSSCKGTLGEISYEISLVISRPSKFDNVYRCKVAVVRPLNLNLSPEYAIPLQDENIKFICCWCCSSGPIVSKLEIPLGGYAPGQTVKYKVHVDNQSKRYDMHGIALKLRQTFKYIANKPTNLTRSIGATLAETKQFEIVKRSTKRVFEGELVVPAAPPTLETGVICIHYHLQLDVKTGDCHLNSVTKIPITIGTVAVAQRAANAEHAPLASTPVASGLNPVAPPTGAPPSNEAPTTTNANKSVDTHIESCPLANSSDAPHAPLLSRTLKNYGAASGSGLSSTSNPFQPTAGSTDSQNPFSSTFEADSRAASLDPDYDLNGDASAPTLSDNASDNS